MQNNLKIILSNILNISQEDLAQCSLADIEELVDSLKLMTLIALIEDEFNIIFSDEEISNMLSWKTICDCTQRKLYQSTK